MNEKKEALAGQVILMLAVALEELDATKAEPDLSKVRGKILSVESTLKELQELARAAEAERLGL